MQKARIWRDLSMRKFAAETAVSAAARWSVPGADLEVPFASISGSLEQTKAGLRLKAPENGRARIVYLPESLVSALKEYRTIQDQNRRSFGIDNRVDRDLVFPGPTGDYVSRIA